MTVKTYLAGPMRGYAQFNFPAFFEAERDLKAAGLTVFNPARHDVETTGFEFWRYDGTEDLSEIGFDLRAALSDDLLFIAREADAVVVLPGWEDSKGARAEVATAHALGLMVFEYDPIEPPYSPFLQREWAFAEDVELPGMPDVCEDDEAERASLVEQIAEDRRGLFDKLAAHDDDERELPKLTGLLAEDGPGWGRLLDAVEAHDGEVRMTSRTGGEKGSKPARFDLIPAGPLWTLAELYGRGALKYADRNWERGYAWHLSFAALQRHAWLFWQGEDNDAETGLPHLASVAWHAFALMEWAATHPEFDDRPSTLARTEKESA